MTWLIVFCSLVFALGALLGAWWGVSYGWRHAVEDQRWAWEQAKARRTHPVFRGTRGGTVMPPGPPGTIIREPLTEVAHEAWLAHTEQALVLASDQPEVYPPGDPRYDWDPSCRQRGCPVHGNYDQPEVPYAFPPWSLLNADPPTLEEEIAAMIANADADPSVRWLDQLGSGQ